MGPSDYAIFLDDGGVMNDNLKRGHQWQMLVGEFFSCRYGGKAEVWAEANKNVIDVVIEISTSLHDTPDVDYETSKGETIRSWVEGMFNGAGRGLPPSSEYEDVFYSTARYVTPKVRAAYPGVVESIRALHEMGFTLHTASAEDSIDLHGYLTGMGVKELFSGLYGTDLIETWKLDGRFYRAILRDVGISARHAIIVDDSPKMLGHARELGAHVIQVCLTGDNQPSFPHYLTHMGDLPQVVERVVGDV
jgi:HAD superfamily hydrolase (TIGR01509 family)